MDENNGLEKEEGQLLKVGLEDTINWYLNNKNWLKSTHKTYNYKRLGLID